MNRLAIIDWGIGGLGFWKEWKKRRPAEGCLYFSDSGFTPYGKLPDDALKARLHALISRLRNEEDVTHCLIACNAASTVVDELKIPDIKIEGIIRGAAEAVRNVIPRGPLSIAGGGRTIKSRVYDKLLPDYQLQGIIAQPLSAAVEAGQLEGPAINDIVSQILKNSHPHLLLACTHYVALEKVINDVLPGISLFDPIPFVVQKFSKLWPAMEGPDQFMTSGSPEEFGRSAQAAFHVAIPSTSNVDDQT